jgi:uncharacterized membrane protein YqiK
VAAEAERAASEDRGYAMRAQAEAQADAERIRLAAARIRHEVEAEGLRMMNESSNILTPDARASALRMKLLEKVEGIIRESVKPMEKIDSIRIMHVDGLAGGAGGGGDHGGNLSDAVVNSALRFRAQAPIVDQLLKEIGLDSADINRMSGTGGLAAPSGEKTEHAT